MKVSILVIVGTVARRTAREGKDIADNTSAKRG